MVRLLFIGERRSPTAIRLNVTWSDGRLCAKTLHDALRAAGISPAACEYGNVFEDDGSDNALDLIRAYVHARHGGLVVALGATAARVLARRRIPHLALTHPAARGAIRKTERYRAHVADTLSEVLTWDVTS